MSLTRLNLNHNSETKASAERTALMKIFGSLDSLAVAFDAANR